MTQQEIDLLIASCLAGEADQPEIDNLKTWIDESREHREYFEKRKDIWYSAGSRRYDYGQAYSRFLTKTSKAGVSRRKRILNILTAAVSAAACFALAVFLSYRSGQENAHSKAGLAEIRISAPRSSKTQVLLPDGSAVWLNAGSSITYSQNYGITDRRLHLDGEALFDVRHNEKLPLVVKVKGAEITDIGTRFNINAHDDNGVMLVSLIEGSAMVSNLLSSSAESVVLKPNQCAEIDRAEGEMTVREQSSRISGEWVNGTLFFDNSPLSFIANELSRRYDINVSIEKDSLKNVRFYCCFIGGDFTLDDVLHSLQSTGRVKCERNGSSVKFYI